MVELLNKSAVSNAVLCLSNAGLNDLAYVVCVYFL